MSAECCRCASAAAWLADELPAHEQAEFERHLSMCPECRGAVKSTRKLLGRLHSVPQVETVRDLARGILARIHEEPVELPRPVVWQRIAAIAAALVVVAGGASVFWNKPRSDVAPYASAAPLNGETSASVARALDWFCHHQEADGSWNAEKWGGNRRFEVALTALPLIALLEGEPTPERVAAAERAVAFVRGQQNPDGSFGKSFREAPYIQSVSTLALLRAYQRKPDPALRHSIDLALEVVFACQTQDGAWGYEHSTAPNLPITLWHRDVVELAASLGWEMAVPSLDRVTRWLVAQPATTAFTGAAVEGSGTDYHRAYFTMESLRRDRTSEAAQQLAAIRHRLLADQAAAGDELGTWNPTDQWGRAGGRIYSTAMASLALR